MNYTAVFIVLASLFIVSVVALSMLHSPEPAAPAVALTLIRTTILAAGAVLVVLTAPLLSEGSLFGGPDDGEPGRILGSYLGALFVVAIALACERRIAVAGVATSAPDAT